MKKILAIIIALLVIIGIAVLILNNSDEQVVTKEAPIKEVATSLVSDLRVGGENIAAFGQVISSDSVSVIPERSGVVSRVNARLGDVVRAGQVVIQLQNSSEQQAVLQARAQLSSSQASFQNVTRDADTDRVASARASIAQAESSIISTEAQVLSGLDQLYTQIEGLVTRSFAEFFNNVSGSSPSLRVDEINDDRSIALENELEALNELLEQDRNYEEVQDALRAVRNILEQYDSFSRSLRTILIALEPSATLSQATIDRWSNSLLNNRNSSQSIRVTLDQYRSQIQSAEQGLVSARAALEELEEGANTSDIAIAQSSISGAQAGLASAQIELAKTRITAPIFGRISSIETRVGELVGPQAPVFVISSTGSKRIDAFVSEQEARSITVGTSVTINGQIEGTISRIAPSINTETGKIKIEIFPDRQTDLVEGAGVTVSIATGSQGNGIAIPIESVFVRSGQPYVYVVRDGKAVPAAIETSGLFGPTVGVIDGLSPSDEIVISARSVKDSEIIRKETVTEKTSTSDEVVEEGDPVNQ